MTEILVNNALSADELRGNYGDDECTCGCQEVEYRLINVNKTVSEMLEFAFNRIRAKLEKNEDAVDIHFNFTKSMYDKWLEGIKPETRAKVHDRFVSYLLDLGYDVSDTLEFDEDAEVVEDEVYVTWEA